MAHITAKNAYKSLEERINKFPQGAPPSKTLYQILSILFTEEEARLVAKLPIKAFRLKTAANIWNVSQSEAYKILDKSEYEYHKKIMNYPDEIDKIVKYELNRLIEKYKRREDPFNEETIKKYYDLYKKLK